MFSNHRTGSTLIEYVLIAAVISVVVAAGATGIGDALTETFTTISDALAVF